MPETQICDYCDQEIGKTETKCPKCGVVFAEEEEAVTVVGRALTVIEKRKAREQAAKDAEAAKLAKEEAEKNPPKKKSIFHRLPGGNK